MGKNKENYGDLLSKYIVEKVSGMPVKWVNPSKTPWYSINKKNYSAIGSILHHTSKYTSVWGSGIIDRKKKIEGSKFFAVRGPITRKYIHKQGMTCPEVYGDPALLLPKFYYPEVEKEFELGIIPHYNDYHLALGLFNGMNNVKVIDLMTNNIEEITTEILKCRKTISSSLHGIIVSHAYGIPSIQVKFSERIFGDGVKYEDYFNSVDIDNYVVPFVDSAVFLDEMDNYFKNSNSLVLPERLNDLREGLLRVQPFN
ncbi:polysaccharide pyruvyl transferase family protein [Gramella sp. KN1008]|uniref:polysaccharide pyruvyl transferase family protein n=1 Tax=Gramella sp. KN1008 TaxID=2529298 RepID=UPI001F616345|nr:polysaccharide pyruvyl transferase family protein [Gramella sp. KN1008]